MQAAVQAPELSVVIPVYNEGEAAAPVLRALAAGIHEPCEILVVYDFDEDTTVPVVRALQAEIPELRPLRNELGRGVLNAMKAGLAAARAPYVLISMADGSDEPEVVDGMVALARDGADVVTASRYMRGGRQVGGPRLKRLMSRAAGLSLHWFARVPIHDPTNNFKLYSRRFLDTVSIESTAGFELALELSVKATLAGRRLAEVPTTWRDRTAGKSNFKLRKWLPHYLHWYIQAVRGRFSRLATLSSPASAPEPSSRPSMRPAESGRLVQPDTAAGTPTGGYNRAVDDSALADRHRQDTTRSLEITRPIGGPVDETQTRGGRGRFRLSWPSVLALSALIGIGVGVPLLIGAVSGATFLPRNDDAAYRRVALDLFSNGRLELNGWNSMTLIGQIILVQPLLWLAGGAEWAFTAATAVLAVVGIVAGYSLARRILSVPRSLLAGLGVLAFPGFLLNTTSFMTDVPAWSAELVCLALGAVALHRSGRQQLLWLVASLVVGCLGFSIREYAIAAPVAVLGVSLLLPVHRSRGYWIAGAAAIALCCGIYLFEIHLPGRRAGIEGDLSSFSIVALRQGISTLSLVLAPAMVLAIGQWWRRWHAIDALAGFGAWLVLFHSPLATLLRSGEWPSMILGNVFELNGSLGSTSLSGVRPQLYVPPSWEILNAAAFVAGLVLCAICGGVIGAYLRGVIHGLRDGRGRRVFWLWTGSTWTLLALFAILYGGGIFAWSLKFTMFDRYLWPLILPLYVVLLRPPSEAEVPVGPSSAGITFARVPRAILGRMSAGFAAALLAGLMLTSVVLLLNADAFDAARWQMGDTVVASGTQADTIDAGFEWVAFHATGVAAFGQPPAPIGGAYLTWWPSTHVCVIVSASTLNSTTLQLEQADMDAYRLLLVGGPSEPLYVYRVLDPTCP